MGAFGYSLQNDDKYDFFWRDTHDFTKTIDIILGTKLKKDDYPKAFIHLDCDIESIICETNCVKQILSNVKSSYDLRTKQDIKVYIELGKVAAQKGDYFLRVIGDSMKGYHIYDGNVIYI